MRSRIGQGNFTSGTHTPANQARMRNTEISITGEAGALPGEEGPGWPFSVWLGTAVTVTARGRGLTGLRSRVGVEGTPDPVTWRLERVVGYDHAERVGCVPSEDVIHEFPELRVSAAARSDCARRRNGSVAKSL